MTLNRREPLKRSQMKKTQPRRLWGLANEKLEEAIESGEGCRACGSMQNLQRAHLVPRRFDPEVIGPRGGKVRIVPKEAIVILCGTDHLLFDAHVLSILDLVTEEEWQYAVEALGEERARKRLSGGKT